MRPHPRVLFATLGIRILAFAVEFAKFAKFLVRQNNYLYGITSSCYQQYPSHIHCGSFKRLCSTCKCILILTRVLKFHLITQKRAHLYYNTFFSSSESFPPLSAHSPYTPFSFGLTTLSSLLIKPINCFPVCEVAVLQCFC